MSIEHEGIMIEVCRDHYHISCGVRSRAGWAGGNCRGRGHEAAPCRRIILTPKVYPLPSPILPRNPRSCAQDYFCRIIVAGAR